MSADRDATLASLLTERTVDIITTGRRSGRERVTEIWTTPIEGRIYIIGTPNAGREGTERPKELQDGEGEVGVPQGLSALVKIGGKESR